MRLAVLLLILLLMFVEGATATEYYLSPTGNNGNTGLSIAQAWATLDYADAYVKNPGDVLWVLNGTYENNNFVSQGSGNATHPVTIKAYNGTPLFNATQYQNSASSITFDGRQGYNYYNISGFKMLGYYSGITVKNSGWWNIYDCEFTYHWSSAIRFGEAAKNCTFDNNTMYGIRYNFVQIGGGTAGVESTYAQDIHITNNEYYNSVEHGFNDLAHGFLNIYIEDNYMHDEAGNSYGQMLYVHQTTLDGYPESGYIYLRNNIAHDITSGIKMDDPANNTWIENNTIYDIITPASGYGRCIKILDSTWPTYNVTCKNNNLYGDVYSSVVYGTTVDSVWEGNNITAESGDTEYVFAKGPNTIRDADTHDKQWYKVSVSGGENVTVEYTDGRTFSVDGSGEYSTYNFSTGTKNITVTQTSFTPDHTKGYYNQSNPILNTVNTTGYNLYDRTLNSDDTVVSSFKMVVTI